MILATILTTSILITAVAVLGWIVGVDIARTWNR